MKNILLISLLFFISFSLKAQSGFEMKGYFGISGAMANWNEDLAGASSVDIKNLMEVGVSLSKSLNNKFTLSGGLNYSFATVEVNSCALCNETGLPYPYNQDFVMLSIPVKVEYALGKIFYAAAGPVMDFQLSEGNNFSDQSGVGYLAGIGAKLKTEKFSFSIFPNYKRHNVIQFEKEGNYKQILQEIGVQFGLGYRF